MIEHVTELTREDVEAALPEAKRLIAMSLDEFIRFIVQRLAEQDQGLAHLEREHGILPVAALKAASRN